MQKISIAIVLQNSLLALGLKQVLLNLYDLEARSYSTMDEMKEYDNGNSDLYITESTVFAANPGFFIPRRAKLLVLSDTDSCDDNIGYILNSYADEATLLQRISSIIEQVKETKNTGNDLSLREIDVLCLVASGLTNKEIADKLNISTNTVLSHRKNITAKLGIKKCVGFECLRYDERLHLQCAERTISFYCLKT